MKIKDETEPVYLVDFCRRKDCQQIKVIDTNDEEIKSFVMGIFSDKRKKGNARGEDGTLVRVRKITKDNSCSERLISMPIYNISPSQARIYTQKCVTHYFEKQ